MTTEAKETAQVIQLNLTPSQAVMVSGFILAAFADVRGTGPVEQALRMFGGMAAANSTNEELVQLKDMMFTLLDQPACASFIEQHKEVQFPLILMLPFLESFRANNAE